MDVFVVLEYWNNTTEVNSVIVNEEQARKFIFDLCCFTYDEFIQETPLNITMVEEDDNSWAIVNEDEELLYRVEIQKKNLKND